MRYVKDTRGWGGVADRWLGEGGAGWLEDGSCRESNAPAGIGCEDDVL